MLHLIRDDKSWDYERALETALSYFKTRSALFVEIWDSKGKRVFCKVRPKPRRRILRKRRAQ